MKTSLLRWLKTGIFISLFFVTSPELKACESCNRSFLNSLLGDDKFNSLISKEMRTAIAAQSNYGESPTKWVNDVLAMNNLTVADLSPAALNEIFADVPVPVQLTGTCHYLQCARIMKAFADVMGDKENGQKYEKLSEKLKNLVKAEFWDKPVEGKINRQTLFSTLLYHEIIPKEEKDAARDSLLNAVKNGPSGHFSTGIFGTKYILETLSEHHSPQTVFNIVNSTTYPGWGFMIDRGATTIWETWKESDNTYSNCHPMFGTVTEWYYRWLGGIRPDPQNPGFKTFTLAPATPEGLDFVKCTYQSPYGEIVSNWQKNAEGSYRYEIKIPAGSTANVKLPVDPSQTISFQKNNKKIDKGKIEGLGSGSFKLDEGSYIITVLTIFQHTCKEILSEELDQNVCTGQWRY